jgi:hypothetical protein
MARAALLKPPLPFISSLPSPNYKRKINVPYKRTLLIDTDTQASATWWVNNQSWTFDLAQETNP